jgi:hypothetical protein
MSVKAARQRRTDGGERSYGKLLKIARGMRSAVALEGRAGKDGRGHGDLDNEDRGRQSFMETAGDVVVKKKSMAVMPERKRKKKVSGTALERNGS